ncbi:MAG: hypothetical protein OHK0029_21540 [Armatimonadaceae bacterium]
MLTALLQEPETSSATMRLGPYQLKNRISSTGSAAIYEGFSERFNRPVVLKLYTPQSTQSSDEQWQEAERWLQVMNLVAQLANPPRTHAHLARVLDVRTFVESAQGVCHFAVLEVVRGESLAHVLASSKGIECATLTDYVMQIASALDALHSSGVAHGNVSPDNILLDRPGGTVLKLVGFGMASCALESDPLAAGRDRVALARMAKDVIAEIGLKQVLPTEAKKVLLQGMDPVKGYATATDFAIALRQALPATVGLAQAKGLAASGPGSSNGTGTAAAPSAPSVGGGSGKLSETGSMMPYSATPNQSEQNNKDREEKKFRLPFWRFNGAS